MAKYDLCIEYRDNQGYVKLELNENNYLYAVDKFVNENLKLFAQLDRLLIEQQMSAEMITLSLTLAAYFKGRWPELLVMIVDPVTTRTFFNTRVLHNEISDELAYLCRKQLSMQVLNNVFTPGVVQELRTHFGEKLDDAAEACLLALYGYHAEAPAERPIPWSRAYGPRKINFRADVAFADQAELPLTPLQREPLVRRHIAASAATPRKRTRKQPAAGAKRQRQAVATC